MDNFPLNFGIYELFETPTLFIFYLMVMAILFLGVFQRGGGREHQRQFCDLLWAAGWDGGLWLSSDYWCPNFAGDWKFEITNNTI